ncbi:hypothetical protein Vretimale_17331 [Volvox reticuliferus]|uniref:Uncharacterized protein n=1 Tax=Volvox reticuliferus TaxID=1737510 RepID=A0A8J4FB97_9CHLO|nr:hypothetical protein Vretifemale_88 [Volvox reticuliferus]GIM14375.1 hypothetical protein Vretimale_17331 [Volvox reticuliferus]
MALSQGPQKTPSKPSINIFSGVTWMIKRKKIKQGDLGEENRMYFHKELNRWVEIGKEEEAKQEAAGPPPILAVGAFTSRPLHKRNLSQRYVMQPDLSISSSMASLGSLSQTNLAGLVSTGQGNSSSGPASTMGSTVQSPPESGGGLVLPASFGRCFRPPSEDACATTAAVLVPPAEKPTNLSSAGTFYVPLLNLPSDSKVGGTREETADVETTADNSRSAAGGLKGLTKVGVTVSAEGGDKQCAVRGSAAPHMHNHAGEIFNQHRGLELAALTDLEILDCAVAHGRIEATEDPNATESKLEGNIDNPLVLVATLPQDPVTEDQHQQPLSPPVSQESRRLVGAAANASDGGAAISLHDGMGVIPVRSHVHHHSSGEGDRVATINGGELAAVEEGDMAADSSSPPADFEAAAASGGQAAGPAANGDGLVVEANAGGQAVEVKTGDAETAAVAAAAPSDGGVEGSGGSTWHSQYYYQQYAYLYQYALGMGYGEGDAVTYAQYYAATYAQQYEAQTPDGDIGGDAYTADAGGERPVSAPDAQAQQQEQLAVVGIAMDSIGTAAVTEAVENAAEPACQTASASAEDKASVAAGLSPMVEDMGSSEDPVYVTAPHVAHGSLQVASLISGSFVPEPMVAEVDVGSAFAVPLPVDLTVAATAAAQHHQSAVTAAVTAAAAAVEEQRRASGLGAADGAGLVPSSVDAATDNPTGQSAAALAPQLLLGLGAAGAKRLTQLSSAVVSLGATVAAAAPVMAALSAATAAASTAATAAGGFVGMEGVVGLSDEDFDRIMHPGDPAKLDGPLPWELPEHLRTSRKFLALCANWQLRNPGQQYTPQLLLQLQEQQHHQQQQQAEAEARMLASQMPQQAVELVAAAEDGSESTGNARPLVEADLSSYERACRFAEFGQPATALLLSKDAKQVANAESLREPQLPPHQQSIVANGQVFVTATAPPCKPTQDAQEASPATIVPESASTAAMDMPQCLGLPITMAIQHNCHPTPDSARSDDPSAGVEPAPLSQQSSQQDSSFHLPNSGIASGQEHQSKAGERTLPLELVEETGTSAEVCSLARLRTVEAANFFDRLGEQVQAPAGGKPDVLDGTAPEQQILRAVAPWKKQEEAVAATDGVPDSEVAAPAAAAAAAIDSVVQALEQLRNSAAAGNGGAVTEPLAGTALLLQIQSSLAQATEALAGMGVDVSALTSLAVAPRLQTPITPAEWTPSASHKRPRVDASPTTPTRVVAVGAATENVATPVLRPGPPVARQAAEAAAVVGSGTAAGPGPGERFQQLGKRLSNASSAAVGLGASESQSLAVQLQQPSVTVSLNVTAAPEIDLAAVEERVRVEERTSWEARLDAVVDSEREAAALVIAAVERERDGLQQRVGELETALTSLKAERDGLVLRLGVAEVTCTQAQDARTKAEADREAMADKVSEMVAERDALAGALAMERSEKAVLAEALSSARVESEDLRRRYTERFSALSSELEATRGSLAVLQGEHDELLLCLGQESTKVAVLTDALRDAGGDPEPLIEEIETEYATMELGRAGCGDEGAGDEDAATGEKQLRSVNGAEKGWEGEDLQLVDSCR